MAKAKPVDASVGEESSGPAVFVLNRNFGIIQGKTHKFYEKGEEFTVGKDDALISLLARSGADLTQK